MTASGYWQRLLLSTLVCGGLLLAAPSPSPAATASARYRVTFDATWSTATHPVNIPSDPHFSQPVFVTHTDQISFWQSGALASAGIEDMAELGAISPLTIEIGAAIAAGEAEQVAISAGFNSPGQVVVNIVVSQEFSLLSFVTMVAPSPDWFLGVSGVELFTAEHWQDELILDLHAYDAGTDSGAIYTSPDADTNPAENISLIVSSPFDAGIPLGTLTIQRTDTPLVALPGLSPLAAAIWVAALVGAAVARGRRLRAVN